MRKGKATRHRLCIFPMKAFICCWPCLLCGWL